MAVILPLYKPLYNEHDIVTVDKIPYEITKIEFIKGEFFYYLLDYNDNTIKLPEKSVTGF